MNKTRRMFSIIQTLCQYPATSAKELAEKFSMSERSIYRYLNELKAVGFNVQHGGEEDEQLKKHALTPLTFSSAEALALMAACQSLLSQVGLPHKEYLEKALQKVESALFPIEDKRVFYSMQPHFTYLSESLRDYAPWRKIIDQINECIRRTRTIVVVYNSFSANETTERVMDPYDFFFRDGNLYLAAFCHKRRMVCSFRIDRFVKIKKVNGTYKRDLAFHLDEYLGSTWRVWRGVDEEVVKFIIYPPASRLFRESKFHQSQRIDELENEIILCTLETYLTPELKSWLLSWGKQIQLLEPEELAKEIHLELLECLQRYS